MSKKMKVLISMLVVVLLVTVIPATVAMAQEDETAPAPPAVVNDGLLARVAEILGISPDELAGAFNQARQERVPVRAEEEGRVRQERAEQIEAWRTGRQQVRQERVLDVAGGRGRVPPGLAKKFKAQWSLRPPLEQDEAEQGKHIPPGLAKMIREWLSERHQKRVEGIQGIIKDALEEGRITEEEAAGIRDWWQDRPEALSRLIPRPRISPPMRSPQMGVVPEGWSGPLPPPPPPTPSAASAG